MTEVICVSLDKDLYNIPGRHYNWVSETFTTVSPIQASRNFYKQIISGDGSDNIPSYDGNIRNTIPKFIQVLLEPLDSLNTEIEMYEYCRDIYLQQKTSLHDMHRNAQCLYIQRKEGDSWTPPTKDGLSLQPSEPPQEDGLLSTTL